MADFGKAALSEISSEFSDRGVNIKKFGAECNANYKNSGNKKWYQDASFTKLATDDSAKLQKAIDDTPAVRGVH